MINVPTAAHQLSKTLAAKADPDFAVRMQRYFPHEIRALGVGNAAVAEIAADYFRDRRDTPAATRLLLAEELLAHAEYHEEVLLGFAVLHKVARTGLGEELLDRCRQWLETYVSNWAQCDDMCLKLLYPFFLGHLELIPRTRSWAGSASPWARRAANVAVVKFVRRTVGRTVFELPLSHVLDNCVRLMHDDDTYVQKGSGWLLKVSAEAHPDEVAEFLRTWHTEMPRDTFRYAVEKMDPPLRRSLMALGQG
ncbi:3-methyladenine DNA glycosylase AlkD [Streptomyces sp. Ag82_O1-12]|uniref:DNA alkylation repair protein n=1 Tax=unclassified Streptomyces TaxID=2593676 RepID=UPI000BD9D050|nr:MULTISPECIES: DNA alkylation repair protein [unclassified Streptomyces]SMQ21662.1 3-methyladenine DNA glycosylase AlkD [Streptomyces sp. Ag82_O1-12]SOD50104.1 3-methyladenine DNA glycosylase AlkD [Streptomyces sp. Ag82_G6-1]